MAKQTINLGTSANDGTGDTLRQGGDKVNDNFTEIYTHFGDGSSLSSQISIEDSAIVFEGNSTDGNETFLRATDPTADRIIVLPNASGTLLLDSDTQTITNKTLTSPKIGTAINDTNGNELIKLTATGSAVNEITLANGASTDGPSISATGSATNLNFNISAKNNGSVEVTKLAINHNTMTANGDADSDAGYIIGNKGSALAVRLGPGTTVGEQKIFTNNGAGAMTVTPRNAANNASTFAQGASFTLAQYDGCTCIWDGNNWYLVGNQGEITIA